MSQTVGDAFVIIEISARVAYKVVSYDALFILLEIHSVMSVKQWKENRVNSDFKYFAPELMAENAGFIS